jgi:DHA3 family macrolide efflux protein-like MFS transporter
MSKNQKPKTNNEQPKTSHQSPRTFFIIWFGQLLSMLGTNMTRFALLIWIYQQTGEATSMALLGFFSFGAMVIASPFAGYLVDRLDRRRLMLWSDFGAGLVTVVYIVLASQSNLQLWHLYIGQSIVGVLDAFHTPAYTASISLLVPKEQYGRVSGLRSLASAVGEILAPMLAGTAIVWIGIEGVMFFDVISFLFAVLSLTFITIPKPEAKSKEDEGESFWQQVSFGYRYIFQRKGLVGLLTVTSLISLFAAFTYYGIFPAMVLARTGGDSLALGAVEAGLGIGGLIGGILMSVWGGPKRKIHGVLAFTGISFLLGDFLFGVGRTTLVWVVAGVMAAAFIPFIVGCNLAIWQAKVPANLQGRVLNVQYAIRYATIPIGYLCGGLLADHVFEPAMAVDGWLAPYLGWLVGTGPGAGMGLMFIFTFLGGMLIGFGGYAFASLRNVESDLPDAEVEQLALSVQPSV